MSIFTSMKPEVAKKEYQQPPEGSHVARVIQLIDLGVQEKEWKGVKSQDHMLFVRFELPNKKMELTDKDGKTISVPFSAQKELPYKLSPESTSAEFVSAFTKLCRACGLNPYSESFQLTDVLDKLCLIKLAKNEKGNVNVTGFEMIPEDIDTKLEKYERKNHLTSLILHPDFYDDDVLDKLPNFLKKKVQSSPQWKALANPSDAVEATSLNKLNDPLTDAQLSYISRKMNKIIKSKWVAQDALYADMETKYGTNVLLNLNKVQADQWGKYLSDFIEKKEEEEEAELNSYTGPSVEMPY